MKTIIKEYELTTNKIFKDKRIVTISDLHFNLKTTKLELENLLIQINDLLPQYIFILGDITTYDNLEDLTFKKNLLYFFKLLSEISKTYLVFGNKDYLNFTIKTKKIIPFYEKAKINILDNNLIKDNDINLIGFNKSPFCYKEEFKDLDNLKADLKALLSKIKSKLDLDYTLFLTHSHLDLLKLENDLLNKIDLILAGHTHNGLVPNFLEPYFPENKSIITCKKLLVNNTRGLFTNNNQTIIVNGGLTKISDSHSKIIKNVTKNWYPGEIDLIKIKSLKK